jgi:uncharacterized membrane protein
MPSLFSILIILHIAGGTTGLITGAVAASVKKGSKLHNGSGKLYFYGMLIASLAALIISWLPNHHNLFLFAVGGFTLYMIISGYRIIHLKRQLKTTDSPIGTIDYAITLFAVVFGAFLIALAAFALKNGNSFSIVPAVFGGICINYARLDYGLLKGKKPVKKHWMASHITRMMGGLIATYTAFLVVNVHIQQDWILWLLPTIVGSVLIAKFLKQYAPKSSK